MYFLLFIVIIFAVYIVSFKDNFDKEQVDKVALFVAIIGILAVALIVLTSIF